MNLDTFKLRLFFCKAVIKLFVFPVTSRGVSDCSEGQRIQPGQPRRERRLHLHRERHLHGQYVPGLGELTAPASWAFLLPPKPTALCFLTQEEDRESDDNRNCNNYFLVI